MMLSRIVIRIASLVATAMLLGGCPFSASDVTPALKQLPPETQALLAKGGMTPEAPIFIRIFKEESQLEIWKQKADGHFYHFKTYPICSWSGELGPKVVEGDKQAPEGFYTVTPGQLNPNSQFHLSFNLGYPNAYDKANGRTGAALMVHGDCRSAGCYAMTDALIEEIYALARESFRAGQTKFQVHAYPFRMTEANMQRHRNSKWYGFWKTLKVGYDDFELARLPPKVSVCSKQYLVNADFFGHIAEPDPAGICPASRRMPIQAFNPFPTGPAVANAPQNATPAPNTRVAFSAPGTPAPQATHAIAQTKPAPAAPPAARPAALSSTPAAIARPVQPAQQPQPVQPNTQPVAATFGPTTVDPQPGTDKTDEHPAITQGLHNVVESGKGDMITPGSQPR